MHTKVNKGFTLLEILLVIAAIGILAAIVLVAINPTRQIAQVRDAQRRSDINTIYKALEQYLIDNKAYPEGITEASQAICNNTVTTACVNLNVFLVPTYISSIPKDPSGGVYKVYINPENNRIGVEAPGVELGQSLAVNPILATTAPSTPTPTPIAWTPTNITTQLWLDSADSSTITTVGSKVSQWNDKSGNARNASQSIDANRPTYTTAGLNGLNVVTFTTTSFQSMVLSSVMASGSTSGSIFWVQKNDQDPPTQANSGALFHNDWSTDGNFNHAPWEDGNIYTNVLRNSRVNAGNPTPLFTSPRILGIESNSSSYKILIDGTSFYTAGGSFVLSAGNKTLGIPSGYGFRGYAAEIIIVNSVLSSGDREKIEGYLAHKWGITGNLDAGHPYKSVAPTL